MTLSQLRAELDRIARSQPKGTDPVVQLVYHFSNEQETPQSLEWFRRQTTEPSITIIVN